MQVWVIKELIVDDSLINKVYEITFSPAARSSTLGYRRLCRRAILGKRCARGVSLQEAFSKAIEAILLVMSVVLVLSSCRDPNVVSLSSMHRRYLIRRIEASAYVDIDVLRDIVHLSLPLEERAQLAASHFTRSHSELSAESDSLVSFITKVILDRVGVVRVEDVVERTGYSHTYVSEGSKSGWLHYEDVRQHHSHSECHQVSLDSRYRGVTGLDIGTGLGYYDQSHFDRGI